METKTRVLKMLNLTPEQYEQMMFSTYIDWCASRTKGKKSLQKILTCQPLFVWWQRELERLELDFLNDMEAMHCLDPDVAIKVYNFQTRKIYSRFSKPLMNKANDF